MTEKQLKYIECIERAYVLIDRDDSLGCCNAIDLAAYHAEPLFLMHGELMQLFNQLYQDDIKWIYYWDLTEEGKQQRLIALSLMIDIIKKENLFK